MKRFLTLFLLCIIIFSNALAAENLLYNGEFEDIKDSFPEGYYTDAYISQEGATLYAATKTKVRSGNYSFYIKNITKNDARIVQNVAVEPNSYYKLSGYILANTVDGKGANLSIGGVYAFSTPVFDTHDKWEYVELYGETGKNQSDLDVYIRLGGYGGESRGYAYFDDVKLEKLDSKPGKFTKWYRDEEAKKQVEEAQKDINYAQYVYMLIIYALFMYIIFNVLKMYPKFSKYAFFAIIALSYLLRIYISYEHWGHLTDMSCFTGWARRAFSEGTHKFYGAGFCDYPPLYMLLLYVNGFLFNIFNPSNNVISLITKFIPMLCDILTAILIYAIANKKQENYKASFIAIAYVLNPVSIMISAGWGQIDSVMALFLVLAVYMLINEKVHFAILLYTISCMIKPQALIYGPIALMYLIKVYRQKNLLKQIIIGIIASSAVFFGITLLFTDGFDVTWIFQKYIDTLSSYKYATINTANLYYLLGANWTKLTQEAPAVFYISSYFILVISCIAILVYVVKNKYKINSLKFAFLILLFALRIAFAAISLFSRTYEHYGTLFTVFSILFVFILLMYGDRNRIAYYMSVQMIIMFAFGVKMHERYIYYVYALLMFDYALNKEKTSLKLFYALIPNVFLNIAIVLINTILLGIDHSHLNSNTLSLAVIMSIYMVLVAIYSIYTAVFTEEERSKFYSVISDIKSINSNKAYKLGSVVRIDRLDIVIMLAITIVYSFFGYYKLGSLKAPQTEYVFTASDEKIVLELDESKEFELMYYGAINYNTVYFSTSEDGENWSQEYRADLKQSEIFKWKYLTEGQESDNGEYNYKNEPLHLKGKYIQIRAEEAGVRLSEIVLCSVHEYGMEYEKFPIKAVKSHTGYEEEVYKANTDLYLFDEQDTISDEPYYYNSFYFDEIYHARTAYEHLHGMKPYETTHPPLGKLIMSLGIAIFGMTPFGYRFFGVFVGVLMLPVMYVIAKYLFKHRAFSSMAAILLASDLLHLTQTRIATIDSYPVLFIMMSYMFMLRYAMFNREWRSSLISLFLCGVSFGLSIASKWIGFYSGAGLAVIFFARLVYDIRVNNTSRESIKKAIKLCLYSILFFIIIPFIIYFISYIPYFASSGGITLDKLITAQINMYNYHSKAGLGADHPYASAWWQWPLLLKPMWYMQAKYEPSGYASTIFAFGNPLLYYVATFTMIATLIRFLYNSIKNLSISLKIFSLISLGFLSQYLPWVLVPRGTYMYHYLASVPFVVLSCVYVLKKLYDILKYKKTVLAFAVVFTVLCVAVFIAYYPYATGILTSTKWLDALKLNFKIWY